MNNCCANGKIKLRGAKFVLYDECGKPIACAVTDECGEIRFDDLPLGKYYLKEEEAPCGWCKNDEFCEVVISENNRNECVEFVNYRMTGSIKIVKYGKNR